MIPRYVFVLGLTVVGMSQSEATGFDAPPPTSQYFSYYFNKLPRKAFIDIQGVPNTKTDAPTEDEILAAFDNPSDGLVSKIDGFLARARLADCSARLSPPSSDNSDKVFPKVNPSLGYREFGEADHALLNKLEHLRDVAEAVQGTTVPADEIKSYVKWRLENEPTANLDQFLQKASPELQPGWLYLEGAGNFVGGKSADALKNFEAVLANPHGKPFSEMALFMKARCLQSSVPASDDSDGTGTSNQSDRLKGVDRAMSAFKEYLNHYPKGRFVSDAWGWIGGLEPDDIQALIDFYKEASTAEHPENLLSASNEMERVVDDLDYQKDIHGFDELASHPDLALYMCYIAVGTAPELSPSEDTGSSDSTADQLKQLKDYLENKKKWHTHFLKSLATAVGDHKDLYSDKKGQSESVAILAHAASDGGDQNGALNLVQMAEKSGSMNDDLMFVKAVALQRSNNKEAALDCFDGLIRQYPNSTLIPGAS